MSYSFSRCEALRATALLGVSSLPRLRNAVAALLPIKTPALDAAAIAAALGKKGAYNEAQATHVIALLRNNLKMHIKNEPIPISFGFEGCMAIKRTLDGKSAMLMSDTVLLQEEINPIISAAFANA